MRGLIEKKTQMYLFLTQEVLSHIVKWINVAECNITTGPARKRKVIAETKALFPGVPTEVISDIIEVLLAYSRCYRRLQINALQDNDTGCKCECHTCILI